MKTKIIFIAATALLTMALVSCNKEQSGSLDRKVGELDTRLAKVETFCNQLNDEIVTLKNIINTLNGYDQIIGVTAIDGGYEIEFAKQGKVRILNGKDGAAGAAGKDGKDAPAPDIGIIRDTDGSYYWTLNGEWLLDGSGKKIPCTGKDGKDGRHPIIKIENGYWWASYDGGEWLAMGPAGGTGSSIFSNVSVVDDKVCFYLNTGEAFCINIADMFDVSFFTDKNMAKQCPENLVVKAGEPFSIYYLTEWCAKDGQSKLDCKVEAIADNGWKVQNVVDPVVGFARGELIITPPACNIFDNAVSSKVVIVATDGKDRATVRTLYIEQGMLEYSVHPENAYTNELDFYLTKEAQTVELDMFTNIDYDITIGKTGQDWLSILDTKSVRKDKITLQVTECQETFPRCTYIRIDVNGKQFLRINIAQHPFGWKTITGPSGETKGKFQDDMLGPYWFNRCPVYDVDVEGLYTVSGTFMGKIRVRNPYGTSYPLYGQTSSLGEWQAVADEKGHCLVIDVSNPDDVRLVSAFNSGYIAKSTDKNGIESIYGPAVFHNNRSGTFKDNVVEFRIDSFDVTSETGNMDARNNGGFKLALPGYALTPNEWTLESLDGTTPKTDFVWNEATRTFDLPNVHCEEYEIVYLCRKGTKIPYLKGRSTPTIVSGNPKELLYTVEPMFYTTSNSTRLLVKETGSYKFKFDEKNMTLTATKIN